MIPFDRTYCRIAVCTRYGESMDYSEDEWKEWGDAMRDSVINEPKIYTDSIYGPALTQIQLSNGDKLHDAGFKGAGMTIAVIDAGFHNLDKITAIRNIRVLAKILSILRRIYLRQAVMDWVCFPA